MVIDGQDPGDVTQQNLGGAIGMVTQDRPRCCTARLPPGRYQRAGFLAEDLAANPADAVEVPFRGKNRP